MRKNVTPTIPTKTNPRPDTKNRTPFVFDKFSNGIIQDAPATNISSALANGKNLTVFPDYYEGRTGCRKFVDTSFPIMVGRTGYSAHKVGHLILSDSGDIFTQKDEGNYFNWGGTYELITKYYNPGMVEVEESDFHSTVNGSVMGSLNNFFFHPTLKLWVILTGDQIYTAEWNIPSWEKVLVISRDKPFNTPSDASHYNDFTLFFNSNGIFKTEIGNGVPIAYKMNCQPPKTRIKDVQINGAVSRYRYLYSAARFQTEGLLVDRQTPSIISAETGTNLVDENNQDWGEVNTINPIGLDAPILVRDLWVPEVPNVTPLERQWHFTHFPIWRSYDLEAKDLTDLTRQKFNDPNRYVWVKDLRICAAFYVNIQAWRGGCLVTALRGEFEEADVYSILELDNGERFEILGLLSPTTVFISTDYEYGYGGISEGDYAAAIGNGRVMRGSVAADVLTRTDGGVFSSEDVGKTITNSEGYRLYVIAFIDANTVRIHISNDLPVQGFTIDPTHRKFYDITTDDILLARQDFYTEYGRYRQDMPNCSLGKVIPGFVVVAVKNQKKIYFSGIESDKDFLIGQYIPNQVNEDCQDSIQFFWLFTGALAVICANSTYGIQTGSSDFITLPQSNESIAMLPGASIIDAHIGSLDPESCKEIESGAVELITNEPGGEALRQFNGSSYSTENFLVDSNYGGRIARALDKTKRISAAIYDGFMGYILWRKNKSVFVPTPIPVFRAYGEFLINPNIDSGRMAIQAIEKGSAQNDYTVSWKSCFTDNPLGDGNVGIVWGTNSVDLYVTSLDNVAPSELLTSPVMGTPWAVLSVLVNLTFKHYDGPIVLKNMENFIAGRD